MFNILDRALKELPDLLLDEKDWNSLLIDYRPPVVERLWRQWDEYRIFLHRIHPCEPNEAFLHPHPWASAVQVLGGLGVYRMGIAYDAAAAQAHHEGLPHEVPPIATVFESSADFRYEMTSPGAWHYVQPIVLPTLSVMVTSPEWVEKRAPRSKDVFHPLRDRDKEALIYSFRARVKKTK